MDRGVNQSGRFVYSPADPITNARLNTDTVHYRAHSGHCFDFSQKTTIAPSSSQYLLIRTGADASHLNNYAFKALGSGPIDITLYKSPTYSSLGTSQSVINRDTGSTKTSETAIYTQLSTSLTSTGTFQFVTAVISNATVTDRENGVDDQRAEWILAANTDYLIEKTNSSTGVISATFYEAYLWYEQRTD